tara:strand:- start:1576 stop:2499 length:924 start_codon:yes stop_codon:yes gene_type:complete
MSKTSDKKLWVFGDSFVAEQPKETSIETLQKQWFNQVGLMLHADIYNLACNGSSLDFLVTQLLETKDLFNEGDFAIFALTDANRKWFIPERPDWGNLWMGGGYKEYPVKKVVEAIDSYKEHLQWQAQAFANYYGTLGIINHICLYHKVKFCILPSFRPPISVKYDENATDAWPNLDHRVTEVPSQGVLLKCAGDLTKISTEEFGDGLQEGTAKDGWKEMMHKYWRGYDQRLNHLTEANHEILAKKVFNCLIMGANLDLNSGFVKGCISTDNYRDINPNNIYNHTYSIEDIDEDNRSDKLYKKKFKLF